MSARPGLDEIKAGAQARILDVLAALGVREAPRGGYISMCNPIEKDRHPSFTIWIKGAVGSFKDHRGYAQGDVIDLVAYLKGWSAGNDKQGRKEALRFLADLLGLERLSPAQRAADNKRSVAIARREDKARAEELERKQAEARSLFIHASAQQAGSITDIYLKGRGIDLEALPRGPKGGIRWPHCLRSAKSFHSESSREFLVMLACCTDCETSSVLAIHRTFLEIETQPARVRKANVTPDRKVWPDFRGLVIPLWRGDSGLSVKEAAAAGLRETLVLAEGIETALSAVMAAPQYRTWAFISLGNLQNVVLPECVDSVALARENEWDNAAAVKGFERGKTALERQGRPVAEIKALAGKDLNDTLRGAA